jgi:uncharacterized membrane protein YgaE (UPF0421/DUF939 family)
VSGGVGIAVATMESSKVPMNSSILLPSLGLSIRAALAAGLAVAIAQLLGLQHPLYAMISAIIVTDLSPLQTRQLGFQRLAGTLLGATVGAALTNFFPPGPWAIALSILTAMFLSHLLHLQGAAKVTGYVCAIVVLDHAGHPWVYALYRLLDTVLGIGLAVMVSFVPKLIPTDKPKGQDA